jgi:hypothetical protein
VSIFRACPWWTLLSEINEVISLKFGTGACIEIQCHVNVIPCHHGMARPRVAAAGDGLQIWRVAAIILNKQSRTVDKGWSPNLVLGEGLTTPHCYEMLHRLSTR